MKKTIDNSLNRGNKTEIVAWGMPDYSAGVSKSGTWTAEYAGIYSIRFGNVTNQEGAILVNGQQFYGRCRNLEEVQTIWAPIPKGATVTLQVANISAIFYPFMEG